MEGERRVPRRRRFKIRINGEREARRKEVPVEGENLNDAAVASIDFLDLIFAVSKMQSFQ
jgi:hypothetical protein